MASTEPLEDARGVDVTRIRELLAITPAQRVQHMLDVVDTMQGIVTKAQASGS